jgi:hypothetical protein
LYEETKSSSSNSIVPLFEVSDVKETVDSTDVFPSEVLFDAAPVPQPITPTMARTATNAVTDNFLYLIIKTAPSLFLLVKYKRTPC